MDKNIPLKFDKPVSFSRNREFSTEYFVNLSSSVKQFGTYNHLGARIKLEHSKINVEKFRFYLNSDFDDLAILQYLEYGFPLGLVEDYILKPVLRNHSSSYEYFTHIDKFISKEIAAGGITGTFLSSPFQQIMVSPLMTAVKKPDSRRAVFDASFSDFSLNYNTPEKFMLEKKVRSVFPNWMILLP